VNPKRTHRAQANRDGLHNDLIATPSWLAKLMVERAFEHRSLARSILDPCVGDGAILSEIVGFPWPKVDHVSGVELRQEHECKPISPGQSLRYYVDYGTDFFTYWEPRLFDLVIMNPPFYKMGAFRFIKTVVEQWAADDGVVVSIAPMYVLDNSEQRKIWLDDHLRAVTILPKDTFAESGIKVIHAAMIILTPYGSGKKEFGYVLPNTDKQMLANWKGK
jgi:hypothetical protein